MALPCIVLDIGGVLEFTPDTGWVGRWERRLALPPGTVHDRLHEVWQAGSVGGLTESEVRVRVAADLGLDAPQVEEFMADLWTDYLGSPQRGTHRVRTRAAAAAAVQAGHPEQQLRRRPGAGGRAVRLRHARGGDRLLPRDRDQQARPARVRRLPRRSGGTPRGLPLHRRRAAERGGGQGGGHAGPPVRGHGRGHRPYRRTPGRGRCARQERRGPRDRQDGRSPRDPRDRQDPRDITFRALSFA